MAYYINLTDEFPVRYDTGKFLEFNQDVYDLLNSHFSNNIAALPFEGFYIIQGTEARPDLISFEIYGETMYWWILLIYNNIVNFEDLIEGYRVDYPSITDIEELYFTLNSLQREAETS
jgi:hypothetical protein